MYVQRNHDLIILALRDMEYIGRAFGLVALARHRLEYSLPFLDKFRCLLHMLRIQFLFNYFRCLFCVFTIIVRIRKYNAYVKKQLIQRDVRKAD